MGEHIEDNELVITAEPKTFHFDLPTLRSRINGGNGGGVLISRGVEICVKYNKRGGVLECSGEAENG